MSFEDEVSWSTIDSGGYDYASSSEVPVVRDVACDWLSAAPVHMTKGRGSLTVGYVCNYLTSSMGE